MKPAADRVGAAALAAFALLLLSFLVTACGGDHQQGEATPETVATDAKARQPSGLAKRLFAERELGELIEIADRVGVEWTVLAAATHLDDAVGDGPDAISGVAYQLAATGAPADYEGALEARGGPRFARRALALAGRLPTTGLGNVPAATLPMAAPVDGRVMAAYGERFGTLHDGLDIAAEAGSAIVAPAPGVVVSAAFEPAYGNRTCLAHRIEAGSQPRRVVSCYGNQAGLDVGQGERIDVGETIGRVGCSGPCLRPHLHLQILEGESTAAPTTDPAPFFEIPGGRSVGARFSLEG